MKKTLFSLAFVAVSGVYVAAANHLIGLPEDDEAPTLATATAAPSSKSLVAPAAAVTPLVAVPPRAKVAPPIVAELAPAASPPSTEPAPIVAERAPAAPPPSVEPAPVVAEVAPAALPPLPRPRPTPPPAAVQSAASTDTAAAGTGGYRDGTYTGSSENAYYGRVQVQVTIASHHIASIKVLDYPRDRRTSRYINSQALPLLVQEVIAASSANVDTVSGATLTSEAYLRSLDTALSKAGGNSA